MKLLEVLKTIRRIRKAVRQGQRKLGLRQALRRRRKP